MSKDKSTSKKEKKAEEVMAGTGQKVKSALTGRAAKNVGIFATGFVSGFGSAVLAARMGMMDM